MQERVERCEGASGREAKRERGMVDALTCRVGPVLASRGVARKCSIDSEMLVPLHANQDSLRSDPTRAGQACSLCGNMISVDHSDRLLILS